MDICTTYSRGNLLQDGSVARGLVLVDIVATGVEWYNGRMKLKS